MSIVSQQRDSRACIDWEGRVVLSVAGVVIELIPDRHRRSFLMLRAGGCKVSHKHGYL